MPLTEERWHDLLSRLSLPTNVSTLKELQARYAEPHRTYHNAGHIADCLAQFDSASSLAEHPAEVELALWFHDAVYDLQGTDNEAESAAWAIGFLQRHGSPPDVRQRVEAAILATRHQDSPESADERLLVDIDLSILGRAEEEYDEFEANIRAEYARVPWATYRLKRSEILQLFLDREWLFATDWFRSRYESQARHNLANAIKQLRRPIETA
jgi:predicted metal-dependent HD superfamily phosphohydrolase